MCTVSKSLLCLVVFTEELDEERRHHGLLQELKDLAQEGTLTDLHTHKRKKKSAFLYNVDDFDTQPTLRNYVFSSERERKREDDRNSKRYEGNIADDEYYYEDEDETKDEDDTKSKTDEDTEKSTEEEPKTELKNTEEETENEKDKEEVQKKTKEEEDEVSELLKEVKKKKKSYEATDEKEQETNKEASEKGPEEEKQTEVSRAVIGFNSVSSEAGQVPVNHSLH